MLDWTVIFPQIHILSDPQNVTVLKTGLCRCNEVRWDLTGLGWGPQSTMCIQCEGQAKTQKHWEGGHVMTEAETGLRQPQVKEGHRVPAVTRSWRGTERFSPRSFGGSMALPAPLLLISTLQNCERTNVYYYYYFKLFTFWLCWVFTAARELSL